MKAVRIIFRIIIGTVFIFSGVVKAIDPLGSAYKFHDYFHAFNLSFLYSLSLPLAIGLCTAEFIAGFSVLTGIRQKTGIVTVMILMVIFTPLTLILALTNPVSDCGCFGDAVHLTNWQTFGKNIILFLLAAALFINRNQVKSIFLPVREWFVTITAIFIFILFALFNLRYLPVIDFLPYKTGVKISDQMIIPQGVASDEYMTTFIYEKEGIKKEFDIKSYPANDSSWKFVDQKSILVKKGYQPPVHDFIITSMEGEELTQKILSNTGYTLLMVTKKLAEASAENKSKGFDLGKNCIDIGIDFYILTSSGSDEIKNYDPSLKFCTADETTLKTIVRANPGYLLLKNGTIEGKWSNATLPDKLWFKTKSDISSTR